MCYQSLLYYCFVQTEAGFIEGQVSCSEDDGIFSGREVTIPANHLEAGKFYMVKLVVHTEDREPGDAKQMVSTRSICPEM